MRYARKMAEPSAPDAGTREQVVAQLTDLIARAGSKRFLRAPVAPGARAFPDPWAQTPAGVQVLLRRLAWHADLEACGLREIAILDRRAGKPVTERMPATRIEALELRAGTATFVLGFIGNDDVVGTAAHEIGALFAAVHRPGQADPYRSAEPPAIEVEAGDAERGSVAAVYLGLGVLAANAAFQEYSRAGKFNGAYEALDYDVLRAGSVPMSVLAYALAVQAVVRAEVVAREVAASGAPKRPGAAVELPRGLRGPQADEVRAWIAALRGQATALCDRLGIAAETHVIGSREDAVAFADVDAAEVARDDRDESERRIAFRWRTHRGGVGMIAGAVVGVGFALLASRGMAPWVAIGAASGGHVIGRRVRVRRCSGCAHVVREGSAVCERCGASLRGDIDQLADRLDAEERLERETRGDAGGDTPHDTDRGSAADL
jgi:hypothetical protein